MSGDMFVASMLDTFPELRTQLLLDLEQAGILEHVSLETSHVLANGIRAHSIDFVANSNNPHPTHHYSHIKQRILGSSLAKAVLERTIAIFDLLAEAEAFVHGVSVEKVHFHEIADWDSQADIIAAASLIEHSKIKHWSYSSLPIGGGSVTTAHGELPVPAPATVKLLSGFKMHDDGESGERVTPTGAAILKYLVTNNQTESLPSGVLRNTGIGCGTKRFSTVPNICRLMVFDTTDKAVNYSKANSLSSFTTIDKVSVIDFDIDDMTPEELAVSCEQLRQTTGVVDVQHTLATGKKNRTVFTVKLLCEPQLQDEVVEACFKQTSTIGLRWTQTRRYVLSRSHSTVDIDGKNAAVKTSQRPGGRKTCKIESDELKDTQSLQQRRSLARQAEDLLTGMESIDDE